MKSGHERVFAPKNSGYSEAGASTTKKVFKGFTATSGSAHDDIDENNPVMRQRGRILHMASPIATSAINTNRTNVIGEGLQLKSRINREWLGLSTEQAKEWQKRADEEFKLWATRKNSCDATGVNDFYSMQQLVFSSGLMSGDVFGLFKHYEPTRFSPYSLRLHIIEADRVSTPATTNEGTFLFLGQTEGKAENGNKIFDGVEIDKNGAIAAYYISNSYKQYDFENKQEWVRVPAYGEKTGLPNILHIMTPERPEQYRGVSYLAPVIEPLLQLRRYTESELTAAVIQSFHTVFVYTETDPDKMPFNSTVPENERLSRDDNEYELGPGMINILKPGEKMDLAESKHPAKNFDVFVLMIIKMIGAALEVPEGMLLKVFDRSYNASRAALLEAWKAFRMRRKGFVDDFCNPVYEVWLSEAIARGRINAPGFFSDPLIHAAWLGAEWIGPTQGHLDPVKETNAEVLACKNGFSTHEQSTIKISGGQFDANVEKLSDELQRMMAAGLIERTE